MPKVCKEIFERTVVHTQYKIKEEKFDRWGESYISESKGELKVEYEDKLLEIKLLQCYSNLELTLNTNIYKDGIIVGKVYKIELDSEGDILYFLEPEYKLTQPNDTFKEYLVKIQDVETYIKLEEKVASQEKEMKYKDERIERLKKEYTEKLTEVRRLNDVVQDYSDEIKQKNKEIENIPEKIKSIKFNILEKTINTIKNTTILERLSMRKVIDVLEEE
jgi:hypothetical protein